MATYTSNTFSVTVGVASGSTYTITGTGFGSKGGTNANKALAFTDWSNNDYLPDSAVSHLTAFDTSASHDAIILTLSTANPPTGESRHLRIDMANLFPSASKKEMRWGYNAGSGNGPDKFYIYVKRMYGYTIAHPENFKIFRFWNDAGSTSYNNGGLQGGSLITDTAWMNEIDGKSDALSTNNAIPKNTWTTQEIAIRMNSIVGTADGKYDVFYDNTLMTDGVENWEPKNANSTAAYYQYWTKLDQNNQTTSAYDGKFYDQGPWYMDDTLARVMITDNATYSSSTKVEIQPPTSWSDTSIDVRFRKGELSSGTNHVHVFDSTGARQYVGTITVV